MRVRVTREWLPWFALIVAFLGGVPGIITVKNWLRDRPDFVGRIQQTHLGPLPGQPGRQYVLIHMVITNTGTRPSSVTSLTVQYKPPSARAWLDLPRKLPPKTLTFSDGPMAGFTVHLLENSLQTKAPGELLSYGKPLYGWMFTDTHTELSELREIGTGYRVEFRDALGHTFYTDELVATTPSGKFRGYPGMTIDTEKKEIR